MRSAGGSNGRGQGTDEVGIDAATGRVVVKIDPDYFRPTEVDLLIGDATKARIKLGWSPEITFDEMVREMIAADMATARKEAKRG